MPIRDGKIGKMTVKDNKLGEWRLTTLRLDE